MYKMVLEYLSIRYARFPYAYQKVVNTKNVKYAQQDYELNFGFISIKCVLRSVEINFLGKFESQAT